MSTGESFSSFVHASSMSLYRTAYLLTGDPVAAEELLQDVLVRIYPRWAQVSQMTEPVAYVRRSVVNAFVSSRRRSSSRDVGLDGRTDPAGAGDLAEETVDRELVWHLLTALPARQRAALVLRYFHDLPDPEIAAALGCRVATVRSLVSRGLRAMREQDEASPDGEPATALPRTTRLGGTRP